MSKAKASKTKTKVKTNVKTKALFSDAFEPAEGAHAPTRNLLRCLFTAILHRLLWLRVCLFRQRNPKHTKRTRRGQRGQRPKRTETEAHTKSTETEAMFREEDDSPMLRVQSPTTGQEYWALPQWRRHWRWRCWWSMWCPCCKRPLDISAFPADPYAVPPTSSLA